MVHPIEKSFWILPKDLFYYRISFIILFSCFTADGFGSLDVEWSKIKSGNIDKPLFYPLFGILNKWQ